MKPRLKAVIFDFDGTLVNSQQNFVVAMNEVADKYQFKTISPVLVKKLKDLDTRAAMRLLGISTYKIPFIINDIHKRCRDLLTEVCLFKGIDSLLSKLKKRGLNLSILTSNQVDVVEAVLERHKLNLFDTIVGGASLFGKARKIAKQIAKLGYQPNEVCYVGDETRDILACRKVGIPIIAVTWGFNSVRALQSYKPDEIARSPQELMDMLEHRLIV